MMSSILKAQLFVCALLSVVLVTEWMVGKASSVELNLRMEQEVQAEYQADPLPSLNASKQLVDSYNVIVERPLFIEGRKPLPEAVDDSPEAADNGQLDDWALIGIYNKSKNDQRKVALFRKQNEARTFLRLNETQSISGWDLVEIQDDRVVLRQGGQQKSIMLRKPRPQTQPAPAPKRPVPNTIPKRPNVPPDNNLPENDANES